MTPLAKVPGDMLIIGVIGKSGAGKDAIGDFAKEFGFYKLPLAHRLKEAAKIIFNLNDDDVFTEEGKKKFNEYWDMANRDILQQFGTEAMHPIFGETVWCRALALSLELLSTRGVKKVIVCDVRFPHEVKFFQEFFGGNFIYVERPIDISTLNDNQKKHASESQIERVTTELKGDYYYINNDRGMNTLRRNTVTGLLSFIESHEELNARTEELATSPDVVLK